VAAVGLTTACHFRPGLAPRVLWFADSPRRRKPESRMCHYTTHALAWTKRLDQHCLSRARRNQKHTRCLPFTAFFFHCKQISNYRLEWFLLINGTTLSARRWTVVGSEENQLKTRFSTSQGSHSRRPSALASDLFLDKAIAFSSMVGSLCGFRLQTERTECALPRS